MERPVRRGFSIGEVIVALVLLAVTFMSMLDLLASGPLAARRAEHEVTAETIATSLIEAKRLSFGKLSTPPALTPYTSPDGVTFTPTWQVFNVPGTDSTYLQGVHVEVSWIERGMTHRIVVETQVSDVLDY